MPNALRLKRKLLQQALVENLESSDDRRRRLMRNRGKNRATGPLRWALIVLLSFAGVSLAQLLLPFATERHASVRIGEPPVSELLPPPVPADPGPRFVAPQPLDANALPLAVRRVILDPGHGGEDQGTIGVGEVIEKDLTLDIANRLKERLEKADFEVLMTRTQDRDVSLKERVDFANGRAADIFVSIHLNWIETREVRGVETYFLGSAEDPKLTALARLENVESGYTLSDMRRLLEGIYADVRQDESRQLASHVQRSLYRSLRQINPQIRNRGVKTAPFVVLVATEMPSILAEVSCLSNDQEVELLSRPRYRDFIADALYQGIESYARTVDQTG